MTRPHIDFIHIDDIEWIDLDLPGGNMPTRMKPLSRDPDTGDVTAIVEFPRVRTERDRLQQLGRGHVLSRRRDNVG